MNYKNIDFKPPINYRVKLVDILVGCGAAFMGAVALIIFLISDFI